MRIVHFSDVHAWGGLRRLAGVCDKRVLGSFNYFFRRRAQHDWRRVGSAVAEIPTLSPDVVVCTGDLATVSDPVEFELALTALRPLIECPDFEFLYVPGNHDNYVGRAPCRRALEAAFREMNRGRWALAELPLAVNVDDHRFLLIDETRPEPLWSSAGELAAATASWLAARLPERSRSTLLLHHFPICTAAGVPESRRRKCRNNEPLLPALQSGALAAALCGHIHRGFVRRTGAGLECCAGSLTLTGLLSVLDWTESGWSHHWHGPAEGHD